MGKIFTKSIAIILLLVLALSTVGIASASNGKSVAKGKHMPTSYELVGKAKIKGKMTEGIKITLMQDNKEIMHTFSNKKGRYTLKDIKKGTYQLKAEFEGYATKIKKKVKLTGKKKAKKRNMNLNKILVSEPTFAKPECKADLSVSFDILNFGNKGTGNFEEKIYAGNEAYDANEMIPLVEDGEFIVDNEMNLDVPGLALKRGEGFVYIHLEGKHKNAKKSSGKEFVHGIVELDNGAFKSFASGIYGAKLEGQGDGIHKTSPGQDEVYFKSGAESEEFHLTVTVINDGFYLGYECFEPEEEIDEIAPIVDLDEHITATNTSIMTFTGTVDDGTATVMVNGQTAVLNGNTWTIELELEEGIIPIVVTAVDEAGNQAVEVISEILIDTIAPDTFIDSFIINGNTIDVEYHGTESVYSSKLDDGEWSDWVETHFITFENLEPGDHVYYVVSKDDVGNIDPEPVVYPFTIEAPEATLVVIEDEMDAYQTSGGGTVVDKGYLLIQKKWDETGEVRVYMKFDTSMIPQDADVQSAKLVLTHKILNIGSKATQDDFTYLVHRVNEYWDENLYFDDEGNNEQFSIYPMVDENVEAVITGDVNTDVVVETDITQLVKDWVSGDAGNYGINIEVDSYTFEEGKEVRFINNLLYGNNAPSATDEPRIIVEYY